MNPRDYPRRRDRLGSVTVEFLIGLAVLFAATLAVFQFFMIGITQQLLVTSSIEAARIGAMRTTDSTLASTAASAAIAAEAYLATQGLELTNNDPNAADGIMVLERREGAGAVETITIGDGPPCPLSALPSQSLGPNQLRVTLCFPLIDATDPSGVGNPVGNWLSGMGFDLSGSVISYSSLAQLE